MAAGRGGGGSAGRVRSDPGRGCCGQGGQKAPERREGGWGPWAGGFSSRPRWAGGCAALPSRHGRAVGTCPAVGWRPGGNGVGRRVGGVGWGGSGAASGKDLLSNSTAIRFLCVPPSLLSRRPGQGGARPVCGARQGRGVRSVPPARGGRRCLLPADGSAVGFMYVSRRMFLSVSGKPRWSSGGWCRGVLGWGWCPLPGAGRRSESPLLVLPLRHCGTAKMQ